MQKMKIGIVGCGMIADIYIKNLQNVYENTQVVALCDLDESLANRKAKQYGIKKVLSYPQMLADLEIELVLNLTIPTVHYELSLQALNAGKHVYSEKPLALNYKECKNLIDTAKAKGVFLGCAPDTFLGSTYQKAREIVDSGLIGEITSAYAFDVCHGHENWHPSPAFFYDIGAGPMMDRGPYNLSTLVSLIGPVKSVAAMTGKAYNERVIGCGDNKGQTVPVKVPTHVNSLLQFKSGALGILSASFDVYGSDLPFTEINGTKGSLKLPIPIDFGGDIYLKTKDDEDFKKVEVDGVYTVNSRGLGLSDMVRAILQGGDYRCNGEFVAHCIEIMEAMDCSMEKQSFVHLDSTCKSPNPMQKGLAFGQVGE